jgi:hypothetical protein
MVVTTYNPSIQEIKAGGLWILGQPGLYSKTCLKKFFPPTQKWKSWNFLVKYQKLQTYTPIGAVHY